MGTETLNGRNRLERSRKSYVEIDAKKIMFGALNYISLTRLATIVLFTCVLVLSSIEIFLTIADGQLKKHVQPHPVPHSIPHSIPIANENDYRIYFGILTPPQNHERREKWRENCGKRLTARGIIDWQFIIGRPSFSEVNRDDHKYHKATPEEAEMSNNIMKESEKYNDILFVGGREYYRDTTDKVLRLFEQGDDLDYDFIGKIDDDHCIREESLDQLLSEVFPSYIKDQSRKRPNNKQKLLWGTPYMFNGDEYETMKGPNGEVAPFSQGAAYVFGRKLVQEILDDNAFVYNYMAYGTSCEDANVGKWVQHVLQKHPEYEINNVNIKLETWEKGNY